MNKLEKLRPDDIGISNRYEYISNFIRLWCGLPSDLVITQSILY